MERKNETTRTHLSSPAVAVRRGYETASLSFFVFHTPDLLTTNTYLLLKDFQQCLTARQNLGLEAGSDSSAAILTVKRSSLLAGKTTSIRYRLTGNAVRLKQLISGYRSKPADELKKKRTIRNTTTLDDSPDLEKKLFAATFNSQLSADQCFRKPGNPFF